ncbi:thioester dehydrase [Campylobacter ureolyticus]|uniref:ApeP family dehydratase n=1 Tax=Campylobacter ureolyticus TaxID=827 RepID=UPI001FC7EB82|nr:thioester dehydrase [Campylobacter ureolyticus]MCZ6104780.1 thioester dehydrase [Campylobacter ureolyticus]GKH60015.1 thioester dehydrase [Campylobacter ureolyticus]
MEELKSIEDMLPHSGVMILVDEMIFIDELEITTKSLIKDSPFLKDGKFYSYGLIEIMAQSLGLYKSYHDKTNSNDIAFLTGCRNFEIFKPFVEVGDEIKTHARLSMQDESGFGVYDCECYLGEFLVVRATISVFNPDKEMLRKIKDE